MEEKRSGRSKTTSKDRLNGVVLAFPERATSGRRPDFLVGSFRWFRFRLRNGFTGAVQVSDSDMVRIWRLVQQAGTLHPFAVFDTPTRRIGLNLRHTNCSQFDGHLGAGLLAEAIPDTETVDIIFSDSKEPLRVEVEPDEFALSGGHCGASAKLLDDNAAAALVQVAILFSYCESAQPERDSIQRLQDVSRSSIWIRLNDVALVSAPLGHIKAEWRRS